MAATCDSSASVKRALLVGCNYEGTKYALNGCVSDTELWHKLLVDCFEFSEENITILTDEHASSSKRASKDGVKDKLNSLVKSSKPGDILVLHFSGHGVQVPDQHGGDEEDGLDEVIVTAASNSPFAYLFDDELNEIFTKLPSGVKLTMISDSCHSGTILDKTETIVDGDDGVYSSAVAPTIKSTVTIRREYTEVLESKSLDEKQRGLPFFFLKDFKKPHGLQFALKEGENPEGSNVRGEDFQFTSGVNAGAVQRNLNRGMVLTGCRPSECSMETWNSSNMSVCGLLSFLATEQLRLCKEQEDRIMTNRELVLRINYLAHKSGYSQHVRLEGLRVEADSSPS